MTKAITYHGCGHSGHRVEEYPQAGLFDSYKCIDVTWAAPAIGKAWTLCGDKQFDSTKELPEVPAVVAARKECNPESPRNSNEDRRKDNKGPNTKQRYNYNLV